MHVALQRVLLFRLLVPGHVANTKNAAFRDSHAEQQHCSSLVQEQCPVLREGEGNGISLKTVIAPAASCIAQSI